MYVINTCTVTHIADRKSRQLVRQARRLNDRALVVATGCYAEVAPEQVGDLGHVDLVVGNKDKPRLVDMVLEACPDSPRAGAAAFSRSRTRAFIKVQDGCDNFCTYCIVPRARGRQRSEPLAEVVAVARARAAEGCREVVLTGVHVGAYGRDLSPAFESPIETGVRAPSPSQGEGGGEGTRPLWQDRPSPYPSPRRGEGIRLHPPEPHWDRSLVPGGADERNRPSLAGLLRAILGETPVERVRLSSLEPEDLTPALLALWREFPERLCRHFHLPLQSGSDGVLRRMGRRYRAAEYRELVKQVKATVPGVAITTDLMVGFPGESEVEFAESREFVSDIGFAGMHVFRYSPRPGTPATRLSDRVSSTAAKRRSEEMLVLASAMAARFRAAFVGQILPVLYEEEVSTPRGARWTGLTDNYIRVYVESKEHLANQVLQTRLGRSELDELVQCMHRYRE